MTFHVYENWTRKRVRVHQSDCPYCNQGRGTQPTDSGRSGRWHGPIEDRGIAIALAKSLQQPDTKICPTCGA